MVNRRKIGSEYEDLAAQYLSEKGWQILTRNFRCRFGEIDLVASDGDTLVFVEVKYRKTASSGLPEEAVSFQKRKTIAKVADYYRVRYQILDNVPCRFDVIAIENREIRHYQNAFPYRGH
ncbi:MAG: YraN family protein [Bilifractor sp.]|jgi:putative endonuclease